MENQDRYVPVAGVEFVYIDVQENKAVNRFTLDSEIDRYRLTRKWYQAGYINKDNTTSNIDSATMSKNNKLWVGGGFNKPGVVQENEGLSGKEYEFVTLGTPKITTNQTTGSMLSINANSENPERAMMVLNLLHTDQELLNTIVFGVEGTHYVKTSDTGIKLPDGIAKREETGYGADIAWEIGSLFKQYIWSTENQDKYQMFTDFNATAEKSPLLGFNVDLESIKSQFAAVQSAIQPHEILIASGTTDTDETLQKLLNAANSNGIDKVLAEIQKQYDAWLAGK
ncbi:MAG: ABC transporter substrate-binding protein [Verrucomicrobia bacterium]|nr:ABC transporter substrate-binding protein [Deltaproteobacteria bacterium]